jgi:hypothetical protein
MGEAERAWLARHPGPPIRYLPYDWNLNDLAGRADRD